MNENFRLDRLELNEETIEEFLDRFIELDEEHKETCSITIEDYLSSDPK